MDSTPPLHGFFVRGDETEGFERKAEENGQKVGEQCSDMIGFVSVEFYCW